MTDSKMYRSFYSLVDDEHVDTVQNVVRVQETPERLADPVIKRDMPWESTLYLNGTWALRQDPVSGVLYLWYEDWHFDVRRANSGDASFVESGGNTRFSSTQLSTMQVCLAQSRDGYSWGKPALGRPDEAGNSTNIVLGGAQTGNVHAFTTWVHGTSEECRARFLSLFVHETAGTARLDQAPVRVGESKNGIDWRILDKPASFGSCGPALGDVLNLSYWAHEGRYLLFTRHPTQFRSGGGMDARAVRPSFFAPYRPRVPEEMNKRRIFLSKSNDFHEWTEPEEIIRPDDDLDNLDESFYSMAHLHDGDLHLGFVNVLHQVSNVMDVLLMYSRDLRTWRRVPGAGPLLGRGGPDSWDFGMVNVCSPPVAMGNDWLIYFGAAAHRHDWWWVGEREGLCVADRYLERGEYVLGLARVRKNRLVGLRAGVREGLIVTRPLPDLHGDIRLNVRCDKSGFVRGEVIDRYGHALPGRALADSDALTGDHVGGALRWSGQSDVRNAAGGRILLRLRNATVYGFQLARA